MYCFDAHSVYSFSVHAVCYPCPLPPSPHHFQRRSDVDDVEESNVRRKTDRHADNR